MSEATPQTPAQQEPVIAQPQEVSEDVLAELYLDRTGIIPQQEEPEAPEAPTETPVAQAPVVQASNTDEVAQLKQQLGQVQGALAYAAQNQQNTPVAQGPTLEEQIVAENPELDASAVKWLADTSRKIAASEIETAVKPLQDQMQQMQSYVQASASKETLSTFDTEMNALAEQAGIPATDTYTRNSLRDVVTARGMRAHGNAFNMDHARQIFAEANNERLQTGHQQNTQYVEQKTNETNNAPPVAHAESNAGGGIESIQNAIRDPKNKSMDFRSSGMQDMVTSFLNAGDKAVSKLLGSQ